MYMGFINGKSKLGELALFFVMCFGRVLKGER